MKIFRAATYLLAVALVISALLHLALLASDSAEYRRWVGVQIAIQLVAAGLLVWQVRAFKLGALFVVATLLLLGIYINAIHLNYGNGPVLWLAPLIILGGYGYLASVARRQFLNERVALGT